MNIYSERFLALAGVPNVWKAWFCPIGKRAVVKSLSVVNAGGVACTAYLQIGPAYAYTKVLPAAVTSDQVEMYHVLYGGSTMQIMATATSVYIVVSGYLFDDPTNAGGPPGLTSWMAAADHDDPVDVVAG